MEQGRWKKLHNDIDRLNSKFSRRAALTHGAVEGALIYAGWSFGPVCGAFATGLVAIFEIARTKVITGAINSAKEEINSSTLPKKHTEEQTDEKIINFFNDGGVIH